jgi:hypothetical protein
VGVTANTLAISEAFRALNNFLQDRTDVGSITGDLRLTYLVNPFSALHVGYTEGRENLDIDNARPATLRILESASPLTSRQLVLTTSYRIGL